MSLPCQTSSQLAADSALPVPLVIVVVSSNRVRLNTTQGPTINPPKRQATNAMRMRRPQSAPRTSNAEGEDDQGEQEDQLGAAQRRGTARQAEPHRVPRPRPLPERVRGGEGDRGHEDRHGLGEDHAVVDPDLRVDGGDGGGDEAGRVARQPARQQADDHDGAGTEHRRRQTVRGHTVEPDRRPQCEVRRVERRVPGAGTLAAVEEPAHRIHEPRAVGQRVGLPVVVERVAPEPVPVVAGRVGGRSPPEHVHDAHDEAEQRDAGQPRQEAVRRSRRTGRLGGGPRVGRVGRVGPVERVGGRGGGHTDSTAAGTAVSAGSPRSAGSAVVNRRPRAAPERVDRDRGKERGARRRPARGIA